MARRKKVTFKLSDEARAALFRLSSELLTSQGRLLEHLILQLDAQRRGGGGVLPMAK